MAPITCDILTPADAQTLQDDARTRGEWLVWFVSPAGPDHHARFMARAHTADHVGGVFLPGALVAPTLDELRAQLPAGLGLWEPMAGFPADVIETWG